MSIYTRENMTALITSHGNYADGLVLRDGVTVGTIIYAPYRTQGIDDMVDDCPIPYSMMVFTVMILGRISPAFIDIQNALDWAGQLFNLSTEEIF